MSSPDRGDVGSGGSGVATVDLSKIPAHVKNPRTKSFKSCTEEEKRAFFAEKKAAKKERAKVAKADAHECQKKRWEALTDAEKAEIKAEASVKYELKRKREEELHQQRLANMAEGSAVPTLAFDLQFESVMNSRGVKSTVSQVKYSYSMMRAAGFPVKPLIYSPAEAPTPVAGAPYTCISEFKSFDGFRKYPLPMIEASWEDFAKDRNVVYLSADSDNVLTTLEPGTTYMIGAFVDHNSKKGLTNDFAKAHNVRTARLPIQESIDATHICRVLTINHVVESIVHFSKSTSWTEAFTSCLPMRNVPTTASGDQRVGENSDGDGGDAAVCTSAQDGP